MTDQDNQGVDVYASPQAELSTSKPGNAGLYEELQSESTWKLFFFIVITLGIYAAVWLLNKTKLVNERLGADSRISNGFYLSALIVTVVSALMVIPYLFSEVSVQYDQISGALDKVSNIMLLIWSFKVRNRIHELTNADSGTSNWFSGLGTFFFQSLYINYKINKLANGD